MRLVLISGLGGDGRLTRPVQVPGVETIAPDHIPPRAAEDLPAYAARVADAHGVRPTDVIGGASFGGMLAAEIARQRPVAGLVLLGTCVRPSPLKSKYRWLHRLSPLIPDRALSIRAWRPFVRARFAPIKEEAVDVIVAMAAASSPAQVRAFFRMLMSWDGVERFSCPVLSIHGDRDRIIPIACAEPGLVLENAGHSFTLTHAPQTIEAIRVFLSRK
jgi:pimeloyl-ACP methyl ester carboxylesterase